MKKSKARREEHKENVLIRLLIAAVIGFLIFGVLIFLFSFIEFKVGLGKAVYLPALCVIGAFSGFLNGFVAVKPLKRGGVPFGASSGAIQAALCSIVIFAVNHAQGGKWLLILMGIIIVLSIAGGILASNLRLRKKY